MNPIETQQRLLQALQDPARYPHPARTVERIETHISTVLLAGDFAYKIKKPIDLGFLDFTQLQRRGFFCAEEVRLNGRLAPEIYLDRVAITGSAEAPVLDGAGEPIEYAVRMRRFPQEALLDRLLDNEGLPLELMDRLAARLAEFHAAAEIAPEASEFGRPDAVAAPIRDTLQDLKAALPEERLRLAALERWLEAELARLQPALLERRVAGRIRECHGDLHLANIALWNDRLQIFDGIEFDPALRWIDVMADLAFAIMDLEHRRAPLAAHRLRSAYLEAGGDYDGLRVLDLYQAYRALVRAKIAAVRQAQLQEPAEAGAARAESLDYLSLAERYTQPRRARLLVTRGLSGSGKSTVAQALVDRLGLVRIRSDLERKRLQGRGALERGGDGIGEGLYAADIDERTYARLANLAATALSAGYSVIVDATCLRAAQLERFRNLASGCGAALTVLAVEADPQCLQARIAARLAAGTDASDADLAVLRQQQQMAAPLPPGLPVVSVRTDRSGWLDSLLEELRDRSAAGSR